MYNWSQCSLIKIVVHPFNSLHSSEHIDHFFLKDSLCHESKSVHDNAYYNPKVGKTKPQAEDNNITLNRIAESELEIYIIGP